MRHLEEGEIHAWLDGALDAEEAHRVEAHAAACAECAAAVAEARGLIAGASRVLLALDDVPGGVIPGVAADRERQSRAIAERVSAEGRRRSPWRFLTSRPARIAAGLVLVAGIGALATRHWGEPLGSVVAISAPMDAEKRGASDSTAQLERVVADADLRGIRAREDQSRRVADGLASGAAPARAAEAAPEVPVSTPAPVSPPGGAIAQERGRRSDINETRPGADTRTAIGSAVTIDRSRALQDSVRQNRVASAVGALEAKLAGVRVATSDSAGRVALPRRDSISATALRRREEAILLRTPARFAADSVSSPMMGTITGQVTSGDGRPVDFVMVQLLGTNRAAQTDSIGNFTITDVAPGMYALDARRIGYERKEVGVRVMAGEAVEANVALAQSTLRLQNVVVAGAAEARLPASIARLSSAPSTCYVLTVETPANVSATGQRERSEMMIRLEPTTEMQRAIQGQAGGGAGGRGGGDAQARAAAPPPAANLAARRLATDARWERIIADSILVRWFESTPLEMRATLQGESLRGTVISRWETDPAKSSRVTGRRIPCGGE